MASQSLFDVAGVTVQKFPDVDIRSEAVKGDVDVMVVHHIEYSEFNVIGSGGYSEVVAGLYDKLGTLDRRDFVDVAVKLFKIGMSSATDVLRELRILRSFKCRYIVACYGLLSPRMPYSIVLQRASWTFTKYFSDDSSKCLEELHRCWALYDVSKGFEYIHAQNYSHGDVSTDNLLLTSDYIGLVSDVGKASEKTKRAELDDIANFGKIIKMCVPEYQSVPFYDDLVKKTGEKRIKTMTEICTELHNEMAKSFKKAPTPQHGDSPCCRCPLVFESPSDMERHAKFHNPWNLKVCKNCDLRFANDHSLNLHTPELENVADGQYLLRSLWLHENGRFPPKASFNARRQFLAAEDDYLSQGMKRQSRGPNPMDPTQRTEMLEGNMMNMIPMIVVGDWISWTFSGFVTTRVPFPLTLKFKAMLQRGVDLVSLDLAWGHSQTFDEGSKNPSDIRCRVCESKVLLANTATWHGDVSVEVPLARQQKNVDTQMEQLTGFWAVKDMYDFENIAFTGQGPSGSKYLACADCDYGPLGFVDPEKKLHFVSLERLKFA